jgi:hypothetical protein
MKSMLRWGVWACVPVMGALATTITTAQAPQSQVQSEVEVHIKYNSGQEVVPIYEGWERLPDGSYNMVFGYLNRNHVQEPIIPIGAQNGFEPGPADRGQPTFFYPRENHWMFRVPVPKDWDKKRELVWTVIANGRTEKARGVLTDIMEVDRKVEAENNGGGAVNDDILYKNQRPILKITSPAARIGVNTPLALSADISDDGIPVPRGRGGRGAGGGEPTLRGAPPSPVNVPLPAAPRPPTSGGLSVLWIVYRGPAKAAFEPAGYIAAKDGKVATQAVFSQPGTYVLRAIAFDGMLRSTQDLTVTVN